MQADVLSFTNEKLNCLIIVINVCTVLLQESNINRDWSFNAYKSTSALHTPVMLAKLQSLTCANAITTH